MISSHEQASVQDVAAVVCAKNASVTIGRCLASSRKCGIDELIVVDGRSTDTTCIVARGYTDRVFTDGGRGLAYARQLGAEQATKRFVLYLDADAELPSAETLKTMIRELQGNDWVAIHAQLVDPTPQKSYWEDGEDFHWRVRLDRAGQRRFLHTIVCLIERESILRYKFDPFFEGAAEDGEFYYRVRLGGESFGMSTAVAHHYHRSSIKEFVQQRIWYGRGNARFACKHGEMLCPLLCTPFALVGFGLIFVPLRYGKLKYAPF